MPRQTDWNKVIAITGIIALVSPFVYRAISDDIDIKGMKSDVKEIKNGMQDIEWALGIHPSTNFVATTTNTNNERTADSN